MCLAAAVLRRQLDSRQGIPRGDGSSSSVPQEEGDAWTTRHLDRAGARRIFLWRQEVARTLALAWSGHDRVQEGPGHRRERRGAASGGRSDQDRRDARGGDWPGEAPDMTTL